MTADPLFDLTGKIALITGGSRGLGRQMALAFADRGADIIIASRKADACEIVAESVRQKGRRALAIGLHAGRWDAIDACVKQVYAQWGRVDILVNNAGMSPAAPVEEVSEAMFDSVLNLNFKGPFRLSSLIGRRMYDGDGGVIINVSSSGAIIPLPHAPVYGAAKAALNAFTQTLAWHFAPRVRANVLSAGPFLTDVAKAWPEEKRRKSENALGRPGDPEEIITAALFLASPHSSYTTGTFLQVDGGLH